MSLSNLAVFPSVPGSEEVALLTYSPCICILRYDTMMMTRAYGCESIIGYTSRWWWWRSRAVEAAEGWFILHIDSGRWVLAEMNEPGV